eukprot:m.196731 g.196731  ORF g.196731 m.196731 type:complete len:74 (+) comp14909_c1_seq16:1024-1245(+)
MPRGSSTHKGGLTVCCQRSQLTSSASAFTFTLACTTFFWFFDVLSATAHRFLGPTLISFMGHAWPTFYNRLFR